MADETIYYDQLPLTFEVTDGTTLTGHLISLIADTVSDVLDRVEITVLMDSAEYARIDSEALFNLTPEVRGPGQNQIEPERPVEIELRLHPDYLSILEGETESVREVGAFLLHLSQNQTDHPLLSTANWYALRVKQEQELPPELQRDGAALKTGYSTSWIENLNSHERMSAGLHTLIKTLEADQWTYIREVGDTTLMSRYIGENDERWTVYSQIRDEESFCIIYGICPVRVVGGQLASAIEFIARANQDLPIGNFEFNFDKNEIRFKTSLDYEGADLTIPLVRQLLRGNVAMMERYLPGLRGLLEEGLSLDAALHLVEE